MDDPKVETSVWTEHVMPKGHAINGSMPNTLCCNMALLKVQVYNH